MAAKLKIHPTDGWRGTLARFIRAVKRNAVVAVYDDDDTEQINEIIAKPITVLAQLRIRLRKKESVEFYFFIV
jgi:predicted membrane chloride channel (bestrophin family)